LLDGKPMPNKLSLALFACLAACSGSNDQVLTGRIAPGFPTTVTQVRAIHNGAVIATSAVAADGSFSLNVAPSTGIALQLVGADKIHLVFPRVSGSVDQALLVRGGGSAFSLGQIHFVGTPGTTTFSFHNGPTAAGDCTDGEDAAGDTCIDDDDTAHGTCDGDSGGDSSGNDAEGSDDVSDGLPDDGDAVAEHNFPSDGCGDDGDGGEGSDGGGSDSGSDGSGSGS
jgi:hypothetical protein